MRKRDGIISKVKARLKESRVKFGVKIPSTIEEAKHLDKLNGNELWQKAIAKEMTNVSIAFEVLSDDQPIPKGWTCLIDTLVRKWQQ